MSTGLLQGATIGSYLVRQEIGSGGMGSVYLAEHTMLGRRAALKVLRPELSVNQEMVTRFFNEARAASAIKSPGIVEIYDFGKHTDGSAYIVMELLEGESLSARLRRFGCLPLPQALTIARQLASALAPAHRAGIVHRDLKPDNVYLVPDAETASGERVKILDFGIAKLSGDGLGQGGGLTSTKTVMGSPQYMSPEQCRGAGIVDARSDLYSLGCILYELVCGRPPFMAEGFGELMGAHLHVPPPPLAMFSPAVPPDVEALVQRVLAKNPAHRPQTAEELAAALSELVAVQRPAAATMHVAVPSPRAYPTGPGSQPMLGNAPPGSQPMLGNAPPGSQPMLGNAPPGSQPMLGNAPPGSQPMLGNAPPGYHLGHSQPHPGYQAGAQGASASSPTTMRAGAGAVVTQAPARGRSKGVAIGAGATLLLAAAVVAVLVGRGGKDKAEPLAAASPVESPAPTDPGSAPAASASAAAPAATSEPPVPAPSAAPAPVPTQAPTPEPASESEPAPTPATPGDAPSAHGDPAGKKARPRSSKAKTPEPSPVIPVVPPPPLPERLSRADFDAGIGKVDGAIRSCAASSGAKGNVFTTVEVSPAGKVRSATVTSSSDPRLSTCVSQKLVHARFIETQQGGTVRWIFRLE